MSESTHELSIVQSDILPIQGASRKRGRPPTDPVIPIQFEIPLASRPLPHHAQHVYIPPDDTEPEPPRPRPHHTAGPKKRGRPKGSTVANILARHRSTSIGTARRPGRPPRDPNVPPEVHRQPTHASGKKRGRPAHSAKSARQYYLEPGLRAEFISNPCLWEGCKAELQNLETLRRHVKLVHGPGQFEFDSYDDDGSDGRSETGPPQHQNLGCRFGKCARDPVARETEWTEDEWDIHIEEDHLVPYSWHMGDGVKNTSASWLDGDKGNGKNQDNEKLPEWMFDENGKQVTPDARKVEVEDANTAARRTARLRTLLQSIWDKMPEEEETAKKEGA